MFSIFMFGLRCVLSFYGQTQGFLCVYDRIKGSLVFS